MTTDLATSYLNVSAVHAGAFVVVALTVFFILTRAITGRWPWHDIW
ncbi:hypothetical protein [Mycobacterium sp.]|jgi:hypothetical protein